MSKIETIATGVFIALLVIVMVATVVGSIVWSPVCGAIAFGAIVAMVGESLLVTVALMVSGLRGCTS